MRTMRPTSVMLFVLTSAALCPGRASADPAECVQTFHRCIAATPLQGVACANTFDLCKAQDALHGKSTNNSSTDPKNTSASRTPQVNKSDGLKYDLMGPEMLEREKEYAKRREDQDAEAAKKAYKPTAEEQTLARYLEAREQKKAAIAKEREDAIEQDWRMMGRSYHGGK